ncbi:hypothetical protein Tsubulata_039370 [Turnera subulata]|uniref:EF-hand domain-containing protein n=1 Tax=Turnera subulata TaxID=218843 RepID=A0A9Q0F5S6_9ROSI|nr:hypothetical protein Tsubulata_039370 [Turnera subulata]
MCPSGRTLAGETKAGADFRSAFDVLDADHDGKISKEDLRMFYSGFSNTAAGAGDDEDVIGSMMSVADFNRDGFVEYEEFERVLGGVLNKKKRNSSSSNNNTNKSHYNNNGGVMEDVFKVMDKDGDGKLSVDDLKSYMQWAGFDATDDDIKAMIRLGGGGAGDDDHKDGVSFDDLLRILAVA